MKLVSDSDWSWRQSCHSSFTKWHFWAFSLLFSLVALPLVRSGIALASIARAMRWSESDTRAVLDQLLDNGQVYTTLEGYYKPTNI